MGTPQASIDPGTISHVWDHLVIALHDEHGAETAYLSLYAISYSPTLGPGHVALLEATSADGGIAQLLADRPGLGEAMRDRLVGMGTERRGLAGGVRAAVFSRHDRPGGSSYEIRAEGLHVGATWDDLGPAARVDGSGGRLSPVEDIYLGLLDARHATIEVDGRPVTGRPTPDPAWIPKIGRPVSSAHIALAELRVVRTPGRSTSAADPA